MPTKTLLQTCTAVTALILSLGFGLAQSAPNTDAKGTWPASTIQIAHKLLVVTSTKPTVRQKCSVVSIDDHQVTCTHLGRKSVFQKNDIVALIEPANRHFDR